MTRPLVLVLVSLFFYVMATLWSVTAYLTYTHPLMGLILFPLILAVTITLGLLWKEP
jgi:hypothetical protein